MNTSPTLFLDCDGVLADFDTLATTLLGMSPRQFEAQYGAETFWHRLRTTEDFYARLPLMPDARELWEATAHLSPIILTGCPRGGWAEDQKRRWTRQMFGEVQIITTMAREKWRYMRQVGDILVDDMLTYRQAWETAGGVFVHHVSAHDSLAQLRSLHPAWFPMR